MLLPRSAGRCSESEEARGETGEATMQHLTWLICYTVQNSQCCIDCRNLQCLPLTKASTCCLTCSLTHFIWTVQAMSRIPLNRSRIEGELAQRLVALLLLAMLPLRPRQRLCSTYRSRLCKPFHRHPDLHTHTWMVCCVDACEFLLCQRCLLRCRRQPQGCLTVCPSSSHAKPQRSAVLMVQGLPGRMLSLSIRCVSCSTCAS